MSVSVRVDSNAGSVKLDLLYLNSALLDELDLALGRGAAEVAREAKINAPKAFSTLTNAILDSRMDKASYKVSANTAYAPYVEDGSGPGGFPPLQSLMDWIRVKRIAPYRAGMSDESLAFLIRRSIEQHGINAEPYMAPALESKASRLQDLVDAAVNRGFGARR